MESEGVVQALQLIDQHKEFKAQAMNTVLGEINNCQKDYFTIAIIGGQNSGKSTLLNYLFKTKFQVLEAEAGRRTTRGVVLGRDYSQNLIIMDVEGNDSWQNHVTGDQGYQKMVSSFALVSANLLIVNIFLKQLGQQQGSQYSTLQTVLRICIDQFKQQSPKTILFCLRDANPQYFNESQYRLKLQNDIQKIWKEVWVGTKKEEEFKKYQGSSDRFFNLELAFLREFDKDYPEDFIEDVEKLRQRFTNPSNQGYLFKRQNKNHNIPASDLPLLLKNLWQSLLNNKQLNLPNEKIQVANYRCQQISIQLQNKYYQDLQQHKNEVRNYSDFLNNIKEQFMEKGGRYGKNIAEKWCNQLLEKFKPKINTLLMQLLSQKEEQIQEVFTTMIKQNIFYSEKPEAQEVQLSIQSVISGTPTSQTPQTPSVFQEQALTFVQQSKKYYQVSVQKYVDLFRQIKYEVQDRKQRIKHFQDKLKKLTQQAVKERSQEIIEQFQQQGQRQMGLIAATSLKEHLRQDFWPSTYTFYRAKADQMLKQLRSKLLWARGEYPSAQQIDDSQSKLYTCILDNLRTQFQKNLSDKLITYFKEQLHTNNETKTTYNFNAMQQSRITQIYTMAKDKTQKLLENLNNIRFQLVRRSSFIGEEDFGHQNQSFLQPFKFISIKENIEHRENQEFYCLIRRKKEAGSKKLPWYLILIILYFVYDDIPSPEQNHILFKLVAFILVFCSIPFAFGQGDVIMQIINSFGDMIGKNIGKITSKFKRQS